LSVPDSFCRSAFCEPVKSDFSEGVREVRHGIPQGGTMVSGSTKSLKDVATEAAYLILVCGFPGVGKSLAAREIAKNLPRTVVLRTDLLRKKIFKKPRYTEEEKNLVYEALFSTAREILLQNKNCIPDATFYKRKHREQARKLATATKKDFRLIEVVCPKNFVRERMLQRIKKKEASDADFTVYEKERREFEKIEEERLVIDTNKSLVKLRGEIENLVEKLRNPETDRSIVSAINGRIISSLTSAGLP
jgi:predicted kinase